MNEQEHATTGDIWSDSLDSATSAQLVHPVSSSNLEVSANSASNPQWTNPPGLLS